MDRETTEAHATHPREEGIVGFSKGTKCCSLQYFCYKKSPHLFFQNSGIRMPKFYCDYCDTYLTHNTPRFTIKPFYLRSLLPTWIQFMNNLKLDLVILCFSCLKRPEDPLCGAKAQGECEVLLPEVDGGSGELTFAICQPLLV